MGYEPSIIDGPVSLILMNLPKPDTPSKPCIIRRSSVMHGNGRNETLLACFVISGRGVLLGWYFLTRPDCVQSTSAEDYDGTE